MNWRTSVCFKVWTQQWSDFRLIWEYGESATFQQVPMTPSRVQFHLFKGAHEIHNEMVLCRHCQPLCVFINISFFRHFAKSHYHVGTQPKYPLQQEFLTLLKLNVFMSAVRTRRCKQIQCGHMYVGLHCIQSVQTHAHTHACNSSSHTEKSMNHNHNKLLDSLHTFLFAFFF